MADRLILNRYRQLETAGKGAFGTVDIAWDSRLQRRVAIKRIPLSVNDTDLPGIQEARTAAMLNDAHIVTVLDFQVTGTEALIIMEYVDGPSLNTLLRESDQLLSLDMIATIINDVASALEYAHENQVLHLDIKPGNILIDHQGQIKVSDFGLSQLSGIAGFTEPQGGTIGYMPPEQLLQQGVDERTDLWALAVLLYQLLTGKNPFYADNFFDSLDYIMHDPLPLPSAFYPELGEEFDSIIVKAMMADKEQRYSSVSKFLAEISDLLGSVQKGRKGLKYRVNERDLDELVMSDDWHQADSVDEEGYGEDNIYVEEDEEEGEDYRAPTVWERLSGRKRGILGRLIAAIACGSFACAGLSGLDLLSYHDSYQGLQTNLWFGLLVGIVALIALGSFMAPRLGSALACIVFVIGIFARGHILVAVIVALLLIVWWLLYGRRGAIDSTVVALVPLLGALSMGYALPLLAGFFLNWKRAIPTALVQGLLLFALALMSGSESITHTSLIIPEQEAISLGAMLEYLVAPRSWLLLASFIPAALILSLLSARSARWSALRGVFLAAMILSFGIVANLVMLGLEITFNNLANGGAGLTLSFILLLMLSLLGVSARTTQTEED